MRDIRKLVGIGNAKGVTLPAEWLKKKETMLGHPIEHIILEIGDDIIISVEGDVNAPNHKGGEE